jgi:hypothetical protein
VDPGPVGNDSGDRVERIHEEIILEGGGNRMADEKLTNRWIMVAAALVMQLCL